MSSFDSLQLFAGNDADEFSSIIKRDVGAKILITTCRFNSTVRFFIGLSYTVIFFLAMHFHGNLPQAFTSARLGTLYLNLCLYVTYYLQIGPAFISELLSVIPNAHYYKRGTNDLKKVLTLISDLYVLVNTYRKWRIGN